MPRTERKKSSTGIYHVMLRGINRQTIFEDNEDNEKFLQTIRECKELSGFELYGYCLMGNHVHLLLKEGKEGLDLVFKRIGARYVFWYNWKYRRSGHLFQDRFKSEVIESDPYFIVVLRYIHQNPKKAGLCKTIEEYKWSSYGEYIRQSVIVDHEFALGIIGKNNFESFMNEKKDDCCLDLVDPNVRLTDEELSKKIEDDLGIKAIMIQSEPKENRNRFLTAALKIEGGINKAAFKGNRGSSQHNMEVRKRMNRPPASHPSFKLILRFSHDSGFLCP